MKRRDGVQVTGDGLCIIVHHCPCIDRASSGAGRVRILVWIAEHVGNLNEFMRKQIASFLLITAVVVWGIWCGGQYFNEARVIPKWLSNPPESVVAYNAIPTTGGLPFFFPFNPLFFL
jgi:hypothetical protein